MGFAHRSLRVYRMAVMLAADLYRLTRSASPGAWPVVNQVVRSGASIALNIAEGVGEYSPREKARFYRIARRSACETSAGADLLLLMEVLTNEKVELPQAQLDEIAAMLTTMSKTQEAKAARETALGARPRGHGRPRTP